MSHSNSPPILTTLTLHHTFTVSFQAQNSPVPQIFPTIVCCHPPGLPSRTILDRTSLLNGFSFLVFFSFFILGRAVDEAGLTASFRAPVNIVSLLTYLLTIQIRHAPHFVAFPQRVVDIDRFNFLAAVTDRNAVSHFRGRMYRPTVKSVVYLQGPW